MKAQLYGANAAICILPCKRSTDPESISDLLGVARLLRRVGKIRQIGD